MNDLIQALADLDNAAASIESYMDKNVLPFAINVTFCVLAEKLEDIIEELADIIDE